MRRQHNPGFLVANFLLIILCFGLGMLLDGLGRFPKNAADVLNAFIINISVPAVALLYVHDLPFDASMFWLLAMPWLAFAAGLAVFGLAFKPLRLSPPTYACLVLTCALGNTSFVGLPMIAAFYGETHLGLGVMCDQGTFLALSLPGLLMAARLSPGGRNLGLGAAVGKLLRFPPLIAVVTGFVLHGVDYPELMEEVLSRLGATLAPLALVSVGLSVPFGALRDRASHVALGLAFKLAIAPALILGLYGGLFGLSGDIFNISVFEAAMPPMVVGGVIAREYDLDPDLAGLLLGVGIPMGFLTAPGWKYILASLA